MSKPQKLVVRKPRDNMQMKGDRAHLRLAIPDKVQAKIKKGKSFNFVMPQNIATQAGYDEAYEQSRKIIEGWRDEIKLADQGTLSDRQATINLLHNKYQRTRGGRAGYGSFFDIVEWWLRDGGLTIDDLKRANGDMFAAAQNGRKAAQSTAAIQQITGTGQTPTDHAMLSSYVSDFRKLHTISHSAADQAIDLVSDFDAAVGLSIEQLGTPQGRQAINLWFKNEAVKRQWLEGTIKGRLGRFQTFWKFLFANGHVTEKRGPFHGILLPKGRKEGHMEGRRGEGPAYAKSDIPLMWQFAYQKWDCRSAGIRNLSPFMLAAFVMIAVYTGIRRAGIMGLKKTNIRIDKETGIKFIHVEEKIRNDSKAGRRDIPIHPMIAPLIDILCKHANPFLIEVDGDWSEESRFQVMSDAFSSMVEQMGLKTERGENLHSLRKNFSHAMKAAKIELELRQQLFGHKIKSLIEDPDVYGALYPIEDAAVAINSISYPGERDVIQPSQMDHSISH